MYIAKFEEAFTWSTASRTALASAAKVENREGSLSRRDCRKEGIEMKTDTTSRHRTYNVWLGHLYEYRIAARDNAGNRGPWTTIALDLR